MFKFIKSAANASQYLDDKKPEVCFIGRSNVGKSSVINALAKAKIAKTSSVPGRTQLVNFFDAKNFRLVDLPGYGFAKLDKQKQNELMKIINDYFTNSKNLKTIIHICDANVIMDQDLEISKYLLSLNKNYLLVLNKVDKENISRFQNNLTKYLNLFNINKEQLIFTSAKTSYHINELFNLINESIRK